MTGFDLHPEAFDDIDEIAPILGKTAPRPRTASLKPGPGRDRSSSRQPAEEPSRMRVNLDPRVCAYPPLVLGCSSGRAAAPDGITAYIKGGGRIEVAQKMAGHANAKTPSLYDGRDD